jgi:hypothetical protein
MPAVDRIRQRQHRRRRACRCPRHDPDEEIRCAGLRPHPEFRHPALPEYRQTQVEHRRAAAVAFSVGHAIGVTVS